MSSIETVCGPIPSAEAGITLPHEHILLYQSHFLMKKLTNQLPYESAKMYYIDAPVSMEILGALRRHEIFCKDNVDLCDESLMTKELMEFKRYGGKTIVSVTTPGIGRDPDAFKRMSLTTGLNIIASAGFYIEASHPLIIKKRGIDDLCEIMIKEIEEGIGDTGIKAGVIKCACEEPPPYHPEEEKVLKAACRAQKITKAGITIHPSLQNTPEKKMGLKEHFKYLEIAEQEGLDLSKLYFSHADFTMYDLEYHEKILNKGITLSYDTFGIELYYDCFGAWFGARAPTDAERVEAITELCKQGYDKQLMISHDIYLKIQLKKYGGYGYSHIIQHVIPELRYKGVSNKQIQNMLINNPKKILSR